MEMEKVCSFSAKVFLQPKLYINEYFVSFPTASAIAQKKLF